MPRTHRTDPNYPRVTLFFTDASSNVGGVREQIQRAFDELGLPARWTEERHGTRDVTTVLVNDHLVEPTASAIVAALRARVSRLP